MLWAFHGVVMNRDTANILQNAPSPWETASADTLKLFQSQQIQEMRAVEGDGHAASQLQAGEEVASFGLECHPEMMPLGDAWVSCRAHVCPCSRPWQGFLWVEAQRGAGTGGDGSLALSMLSRPSLWSSWFRPSLWVVQETGSPEAGVVPSPSATCLFEKLLCGQGTHLVLAGPLETALGGQHPPPWSPHRSCSKG